MSGVGVGQQEALWICRRYGSHRADSLVAQFQTDSIERLLGCRSTTIRSIRVDKTSIACVVDGAIGRVVVADVRHGVKGASYVDGSIVVGCGAGVRGIGHRRLVRLIDTGRLGQPVDWRWYRHVLFLGEIHGCLRSYDGVEEKRDRGLLTSIVRFLASPRDFSLLSLLFLLPP